VRRVPVRARAVLLARRLDALRGALRAVRLRRLDPLASAARLARARGAREGRRRACARAGLPCLDPVPLPPAMVASAAGGGAPAAPAPPRGAAITSALT